MKLSSLFVDPARYQKREKPYSEATVAGIVAEGINLAKFDAIPVVQMPDGRGCVGGDGHSRFEAINRLAEMNRLPAEWGRDGCWEIPTRDVTADEAKKLSRWGNLSRDQFTAVEEAAIFQDAVNDGDSIADIARESQKEPRYIKRMLMLNTLADCIRERIGKPADAGGIDKTSAMLMAELFQRYNIDLQAQQELWNRVFAHSELTPGFIRGVLHRIGNECGKRSGGAGLLFSIPANVETLVKEMKGRAEMLRRAERSLAGLLGIIGSGALDGLPDLKALLDRRGVAMVQQLKYEADEDGAVIGNLVLKVA